MRGVTHGRKRRFHAAPDRGTAGRGFDRYRPDQAHQAQRRAGAGPRAPAGDEAAPGGHPHLRVGAQPAPHRHPYRCDRAQGWPVPVAHAAGRHAAAHRLHEGHLGGYEHGQRRHQLALNPPRRRQLLVPPAAL